VNSPVAPTTFYPASFAVRADLDDAHWRVWVGVTSVGRWWTAEQRRCVAAVACIAFNDVDPLVPWLPLSGDVTRCQLVAELLAGPPVLEDAVVNAVYRMTAHASSLTESWVRERTAATMTEQAYVELCGVVTSVSAVCSFARTIGAPLPPLPAVHDFIEPSREPVECDRSSRNWVPVASPGGSRPSVIEALSVAPGEYELLWSYLAPAQYMSNVQMADLAFTRGTISRPQAELLAGRVAALRQCFF
jgi:alkylhydroperoxidase family enzyme